MFCKMGGKAIVWENAEFGFLVIFMPSLNWRTSLRVNGWALGGM